MKNCEAQSQMDTSIEHATTRLRNIVEEQGDHIVRARGSGSLPLDCLLVMSEFEKDKRESSVGLVLSRELEGFRTAMLTPSPSLPRANSLEHA